LKILLELQLVDKGGAMQVPLSMLTFFMKRYKILWIDIHARIEQKWAGISNAMRRMRKIRGRTLLLY
jgi:hypothetical protein